MMRSTTRRRRQRRLPGIGVMMMAGTGVLAGVGLLLPSSAGAQERDCRCVGPDGAEIENCVCIRTPAAMDRPLAIELDGARMALSGPYRAHLGVAVTMVEAEGSERGAVLEDVSEDAPAWDAGLRPGDLVVRVEDQPLDEPLADRGKEEALDRDAPLPAQRFLSVVRELEPGETVEVEYLRDGERHTTQVTPERNDARTRLVRAMTTRRPTAPSAPRASTFVWSGDAACRTAEAGRVRLMANGCVDGLRLTALNDQLADYFGVQEGVLVTEVLDGATLDLRAGDVIRAIDGRSVSEPDDVRRILRSYEPDETVRVTVVRRSQEIEVVGTRP